MKITDWREGTWEVGDDGRQLAPIDPLLNEETVLSRFPGNTGDD